MFTVVGTSSVPQANKEAPPTKPPPSHHGRWPRAFSSGPGPPLTDDRVLSCEAVGPAWLDKHEKTGRYAGGEAHIGGAAMTCRRPSYQISSAEPGCCGGTGVKRPVEMFQPRGGAAPGEGRRGRGKKRLLCAPADGLFDVSSRV